MKVQMSVLEIAAVLVFLCSCNQDAEYHQTSRPIIDMHLHAFPGTWSKEYTPSNWITGRPSTAVTGEQLLPQTLAQLDRYNIRLAVLSGPLVSVKKWMTAAPERFIGAPQFPMTFLNTDTTLILERYMPEIDELREGYKSGQIGVLGEITAWYAGMAPADSALVLYFALAEELDIPVGIHAAQGPKQLLNPIDQVHVRVTLGNPEMIEEVLVRHPGLRLYLMHAGYPYLQETIALMSVYTNVYADLSSINWRDPRAAFYEYLKALISAGLEKRLMFGSDASEFPEAIGQAIESIESADFLTEQQKEDIFYNNALRFLRLEEYSDNN